MNVSSSDNSTSITLIARLSDPSDQDAWSRFVDQYSPLIYWWCTRFNLQDSEAADVTQEVLLKVVALMQSNTYDPARGGFRAWLKTITSNLIRDVKKANVRRVDSTGSPREPSQLAKIADLKSLKELAALIEGEHERELLKIASERVKERVRGQTWEIYEASAIRNQPAPEIAKNYGIPVGDVYVAKSRVVKMLREEVRVLDAESS